MFDPILSEMLFTLAACGSLLVMLGAAAAVLPWTDAELAEVEQDLQRAAQLALDGPPELAPLPTRRAA